MNGVEQKSKLLLTAQESHKRRNLMFHPDSKDINSNALA